MEFRDIFIRKREDLRGKIVQRLVEEAQIQNNIQRHSLNTEIDF